MYYGILISSLLCLGYLYYKIYIQKNYPSNFIFFGLIPVTWLFILIFRTCFESFGTTSTEYRGYLITNARHYEYWETWVEQTCSRQVPCGESCTTDSQDRTTCTTVYCTEYYDCSYCDKNPEYWEAIDNQGHSYSISKEKYERLTKQWINPPQKKDLARDIDFYGRCGCDGDRYDIWWNRDLLTSESAVRQESYTNIIKRSRSAFKYTEVDTSQVSKYGLYSYPKQYDFYKQSPVLGLEKLKHLSVSQRDSIIKLYEYLNGYGYKTYNKTFVLLFPDKSIEAATYQESLWIGGNRNELVVCVGYDSKSLDLTWIKAFSWTDNKRVAVEIREELVNLKKLDLLRFYPRIFKTVNTYFKPKDFKDFDYLTIDYPTWTYYTVWSLVFVINIGGLILFEKNDR